MNLLFGFRKYAGIFTFGLECKNNSYYIHLFMPRRYWLWGSHCLMIAGHPLWIGYFGPLFMLSWMGK